MEKKNNRTYFINRSDIPFRRNEVAVLESDLTTDDKGYLYKKLVESFNTYPADVQFAFAHNLSVKYMEDMAQVEQMKKLADGTNETNITDTQASVLPEDTLVDTAPDQAH